MSYSASTIGLPVLRRFQFRQHRRVLANLFGQPEEHAAALLRVVVAHGPVFERGLGGGDRAIHVVGIGVRDLRDHFFGRRDRRPEKSCSDLLSTHSPLMYS